MLLMDCRDNFPNGNRTSSIWRLVAFTQPQGPSNGASPPRHFDLLAVDANLDGLTCAKAEAQSALTKLSCYFCNTLKDWKHALQDVREYILDLLTSYAKLQRFVPRPSAGAERVTATRLLQHFLFDEDRAEIVAAHPWLGCAAARGL